jgi:hypothetical protein
MLLTFFFFFVPQPPTMFSFSAPPSNYKYFFDSVGSLVTSFFSRSIYVLRRQVAIAPQSQSVRLVAFDQGRQVATPTTTATDDLTIGT